MKNNKRAILSGAVFLFLMMSAAISHAQTDTTTVDTTVVKKEMAKNFGITFGASYSLLQLESSPYFLDETGGLGQASVVNRPGLTAGLFWHQPVSEMWSGRFAVEANLMSAYISYDTGKPNKEESYVYPLTVEIPISVIYGRYLRYDVEASGIFKPGLIAGIRPVIPLSLFNSTQPVLKSFNLNAEIGISMPVALKRTIMRSELIFSYGLMNIIGEDEENFRTRNISYLGRNFLGLRFYFN